MSSLAKRYRGRTQHAASFPSAAPVAGGNCFVLPAVVFFALFNFYAMGYALYLSFTSWDLLTPPRWVGLTNYTTLVSDPNFLSSLGITLRYTVESVVPLVLLALGLALLLNQRLRLSGLYQVIYFVPVVIPAVVSAIIWGLLYRPSGPVNNALGIFGVDPLPWLAVRECAPWHRHRQRLGLVRLRHPHSSGWSAEHSSRVRRSRRHRRRIALAGGA